MTDLKAQSNRRGAWDALLRIVARPKWRGPGPEPAEDETMQMVVDELKCMRRERRPRGQDSGEEA